jgi:hypothetical protein
MKQVFIVLALVFLLAGCAVAPEEVSDEFTDQRILAEFEFTEGEDIILLRVKFGGEEHLFIFDTGASWIMFDTSFEDTLGNTRGSEMVNTHGKPIRVEFFDAPEMFLGSLNMQDSGQVGCMDLKGVNLALGKKISGVIGMSFLKKYVIQIDYNEGKLFFIEPKSDKGISSFLQLQSGANPDWGEKLKIKYNSGGIPHIRGNVLNGGKTYFTIDTGASIPKLLESKVFKNVIKHKEIQASGKPNENISGATRIEKLTFGSLEYERLIFNEGKRSLLGTPFLSRHIVTFDFPHNAIYLKKGKAFDRVDEIDMTGLHLIRVSNETTVHSVDENSPAYEAGLRGGDIILKVNNKDGNEYSRWELSRLKKSGDGDKITMTIKRGDEVKTVTLILRRKV